MTKVKQSNQSELRTTNGGGRRCVTLGGATTGFGADLIVIDDLMKAQDASSQVMRDKAREYYSSGLLSRFNNPATGRVVSIQQRLHEDDLAAHLLETGRYRHLNLPAIADEPVNYELHFGRIWHRRQGEVLEPERLDADALAIRREELGSRVFNAQYQQNPIPPDGAIVRIDKLSLVDSVPDGVEFEYVVQSWDTAASIGPRSDFNVCMTFGYCRGAWYLTDLVRERMEYDRLEAAIFAQIERWNPEKVLVEDSSNGRAFLQRQQLKKANGVFQKVVAKDSKEERLIAQTDFLHSDRIRFCPADEWWPALKRELSAFPEVAHDDQVDSLSQFCGWVTGRFGRRLLNTDSKTGETGLLKGPDGRYIPFSGTR
jgi:predicted phage terminase large subunit-like protein